MRKTTLAAATAISTFLTSNLSMAEPQQKFPDAAALNKLTARLAPVDLKVDLSKLPANEKASLAKQVEAARLMDALFLRQVWAGNESLLMQLIDDRSALGRARLALFLQQKGPWDRVEHNAAIMPGVPEKPAGANFYPAGAGKEDVEKWIAGLKGKEAEAAKGFYTTIRRDPAGKFVAVPYSLEYQGELAQAAALLREAAKLTSQPSLRKFLESRAEAFITNDYYQSELDWMALDATLEPTIGPYEVYEDEWFNYKAGFEAYITVRDDAETEKLAKFGSQLQDLEDHLPIEPQYRNPKIGAAAPIAVVNVVFDSGDANHGIQTSAFNLPNDERVTHEKGSKRVMLKNIQDAKFQKCLLPIVRIALAKADQSKVSFDAYFTFILMHELMHGLGPHTIKVDGHETTPREQLKELFSAFEESKADVSGMWALQYLIDKGFLDRKLEHSIYQTYVAGFFRTLRFGIGEAHAKGVAMQLNWILDEGGIEVNADGTFAIVPDKLKAAITSLTGELMTIQARGDYAAAKGMLEKLGVVRPQAEKLLKKMTAIPVDIAPRFVTAEALGS